MTIFLYALFHCFIFSQIRKNSIDIWQNISLLYFFPKKGGMAYTSGGYDSDVEGGGYGNDTGLGFTDKAVSF
jgi:hypothetical protein